MEFELKPLLSWYLLFTFSFFWWLLLGPDSGKGQCFSENSVDTGFKSPQQKEIVPTNGSSPSKVTFVSTVKRKTPKKISDKNLSTGISCELDHTKCYDWKLDTSDSNSSPLDTDREDDIKRCDFEVSKPCLSQMQVNPRKDIRRALFSKMSDEKVQKFGGLRSGSRVVPFYDDPGSDFTVNNISEACEGPQDVEDLSLIREKLIQIENQQSNLLNIIQVHYIGLVYACFYKK